MRTAAPILMIILAASTAWGAVIKAYNGNVPFDHKMHRSLFKCSECHEGSPRYLELDKQSAHKLCIGCHKREKRGPSVHCSDCHRQDLDDN